MPTSSSSTLALAGRLRTLDDTTLLTLLRARGVRDSGIADHFDLADKLLDPASVQVALTALDRPTLAALAAAAELDADGAGATPAAIKARLAALGSPATSVQVDAHLGALLHLALAACADDGSVTVYEPVAALLGDETLDLPALDELAAPWAPVHPHTGVADQRRIDALAAERAFGTTKAVAEIVAEQLGEPARELAKGGLALPELKRLAAAAGVEADEVQALQSIAARAGLVALENGVWMPTADAAPWALQSTALIWARLAGAWLEHLPRDIRVLLAGRTHDAWDSELQQLVSWLYPGGRDHLRERVDERINEAALLGIIASATPSTPGSLLFEKGADAAADALATLLPREVDRVYLQHDLSVVSPGPLAPRVDARLRTMADVESHALASSYRVSLASVNRALASGETADTITEFLTSISLSGIPQPLAYLVADAASRYGLVRVSSTDDGRSVVRSVDDNLLGSLLVDQSLSSLSLARADDGSVESRFDASTVYWSLVEAKYPVAAQDASGAIVVPSRRRAATSAPVVAADPATAIVERLRQAAPAAPQDNDRAWLERQLETAVKGKLTITVSVTVQDGSSVDYVLEPTGVGGGRLRGRDRKADIERTLPLSRITAVDGV